jgi:outer membrane protein assembly factor BamB
MKSSLLCLALLLAPALAQAADWATWGHDPARTAWAKEETKLSKENVSQLQILWRTQVDTKPDPVVLATLTAPLVIHDVQTAQGSKTLVYVVGGSDTVYAIDDANGKVFWQKSFPNNIKPVRPASWLCPNSQNATPVIDKGAGTIYVSTSDGKLRGLNLANGEERFDGADFVEPHARNWSLNLIDGKIYTSVARGCGGAKAHMAVMDVQDPGHPIKEFFTSTGRPAGAWGRGGAVLGANGIISQTADGPWDPEKSQYAESVMLFSKGDLQLKDYFTPENWEHMNEKDLDLGSSGPVAFNYQGRNLIAAMGKEGVLYLLDADNLGGENHQTPLFAHRFGNEAEMLWNHGVWGAPATWQDPAGERWVFVPMWGPPIVNRDEPHFHRWHGPADNGSIMAFRVATEEGKLTLVPEWRSRDMALPDPPVVANGVVLAAQTGEDATQRLTTLEERTANTGRTILHAFDAATGDELYNSGLQIDSWDHFGGLAVSDGKVYLVTWDAKVYAFGLKN